MAPSPRKPLLLASLLSVLAVPACEQTHNQEASYVPETVYGRSTQLMPALPCLPRIDSRLRALNPNCDNDFEVTGGPSQQTDAEGKTVCVYTIAYTNNGDCVKGRPLVAARGALIVALERTEEWG